MTNVRVGRLTRLYVWSVVLEPLLFFVVFDRATTGVTGNVARILQSLVVAGLVVRAMVTAPGAPAGLRWTASDWYLQRYYALYMALAVVAGVLGVSSGAFALPGSYQDLGNESGYARLLNSDSVRPVFEYVIAVYYFWYFAGLPRTLLKRPADLDYMFKVFRNMFFLSFALGAIDVTSAGLFGVELLPRHFLDGRGVGARFHGLAGEPRQAFVYLFLALAMLHLRAWYRGERLGRAWTVAILVAAVLTQSASGAMGIVAFIGLFAIYSLRTLRLRRVVQLGVLMTLTGVLAYVAIGNSLRLSTYWAGAPQVWAQLEQGESLPGPLALQGDSIYPLYDLVQKQRAGEVLPLVIGSGFGSASAANNRMIVNTSSLTNPNSQLVRALHETGIVGTVLFVLAFVSPVAYFTRRMSGRDRQRFMTLMLLLVGCCFGYRNPGPFIFLGAVVATVRVALQRDRDGVKAAGARP